MKAATQDQKKRKNPLSQKSRIEDFFEDDMDLPTALDIICKDASTYFQTLNDLGCTDSQITKIFRDAATPILLNAKSGHLSKKIASIQHNLTLAKIDIDHDK